MDGSRGQEPGTRGKGHRLRPQVRLFLFLHFFAMYIIPALHFRFLLKRKSEFSSSKVSLFKMIFTKLQRKTEECAAAVPNINKNAENGRLIFFQRRAPKNAEEMPSSFKKVFDLVAS